MLIIKDNVSLFVISHPPLSMCVVIVIVNGSHSPFRYLYLNSAVTSILSETQLTKCILMLYTKKYLRFS